MASASYLLEGSSLLQVPGLCLTRLLQIRPAALQLLAPLHDVLGLGVPGGCEVSSGAQHLLHLSLVGSHLHPEFLPQNSMKGATSGHSLATGGPEQSRGCALQAEKGWGQRLGNQDSLSHGGGHLGSGKGMSGILGGNGDCYLMLVEKVVGIIWVLSRAGAGHGHVLCYPHELRVAQVVEVVQLNRGLQLPSPAGQMFLQGLVEQWWASQVA